MTFIMLYGGTEYVLVRCASRAACDLFLDTDDRRHDERIRMIRITGPDGTVEELTPRTFSST